MMDEYLENIDTPVVKKYEKLSDIPREPAWTFPQRYKNEARNHHYLNTNPIRIESWTADIARAHLALTDFSRFILHIVRTFTYVIELMQQKPLLQRVL